MGAIERLGIMTLEVLERLGLAGRNCWLLFVMRGFSSTGVFYCLYRFIVATYIPVIVAGGLVGMTLLFAVNASALPQHSAEEIGANLAVCVGYLAAPLTVIMIASFNACFIFHSLQSSFLRARTTGWDWMIAACLLSPLFVALFLFSALTGIVFINDVNLNLHAGVLQAGLQQELSLALYREAFLHAVIDSAIVVLICAGKSQMPAERDENTEEDSGIGAVVGLSALGIVFAEFVLGALTR